jgi:hypothetical protein
MKKVFPCCLLILALTSCQAPQYELVSMPTAQVDFLSDYKVQVLDAELLETISLRPESSEQDLVVSNAPNGKQYLSVELELTRFETLEQSDNKGLDEDDFKLKDHLGLTFIKSYFPNTNSLTDYTWKGSSIEPGDDPVTLDIYFEVSQDIGFDKYLMVLEIDFFATESGVDIPLTQKI